MSNEIQQDLQDDLTTIEPDLMNMTRLFSLPDSVWDAPEYHFTAAIEGGQYVIRFYGKTQAAQGVTDIPSDADARIQALHRRRALRRLCRQTLYDLLRKETGIHPPWGSMTGIRPTHLMYEALNEGMSMADAQEHLVHQFDVAPEKAALLAELVSVQQQLPPPGDDWMDVYIGIPFCTTRCTYCSFSSGELGDGHLVAPYLTALFREMDACAQLLRDAGKKLRAVYVGGGTPTSLNEEQLPRLLEKMMQCFPCAMEYTVEAGRPDTLDEQKLRMLHSHPVTRISINPQTMKQATLDLIGRHHTVDMVKEKFRMARELGHTVTPCFPALAPVNTKEDWCRALQGLSLKNVTFTVKDGKKKLYEEFGEMLFTHFGISGPLVLSASSKIVKKLDKNQLSAFIDLKPALTDEQLDARLLRDFSQEKNKQFKNALNGLFPARLAEQIVILSGINPDKEVNAITKEERAHLVSLTKNLPLTILSVRGYNEAIITQGGVKVQEVQPKTMESKLVPGLYFAGELLDIDALTGGYNLQLAWSTGSLVGDSIV